MTSIWDDPYAINSIEIREYLDAILYRFIRWHWIAVYVAAQGAGYYPMWNSSRTMLGKSARGYDS